MYNNDAFSDYAKKYMDMVFRIAYSYLKCQADADDVTQDALIQLYRSKQEFSSDAHVKNWLVRVTINLCKNVFRSVWHKNESIEDGVEQYYMVRVSTTEFLTGDLTGITVCTGSNIIDYRLVGDK